MSSVLGAWYCLLLLPSLCLTCLADRVTRAPEDVMPRRGQTQTFPSTDGNGRCRCRINIEAEKAFRRAGVDQDAKPRIRRKFSSVKGWRVSVMTPVLVSCTANPRTQRGLSNQKGKMYQRERRKALVSIVKSDSPISTKRTDLVKVPTPVITKVPLTTSAQCPLVSTLPPSPFSHIFRAKSFPGVLTYPTTAQYLIRACDRGGCHALVR